MTAAWSDWTHKGLMATGTPAVSSGSPRHLTRWGSGRRWASSGGSKSEKKSTIRVLHLDGIRHACNCEGIKASGGPVMDPPIIHGAI